MKSISQYKNLWISVFISSFVLSSCKVIQIPETSDQGETKKHSYQRNALLSLDLGLTSFSPIDFGLKDSIIAVECPLGLECDIEDNGRRITINISSEVQPVYTIRASSTNQANTRILKGPRKQEATLTFPAREGYTNLRLTGDVNNWIPEAMELKDGNWHYTDTLNPGRYSYQLVADIQIEDSISADRWFVDPTNTDSTGNGMGGFNSVWTIKSSSTTAFPLSWQANDNGVKILVEEPLNRCIALWNGEKLLDQALEKNHTLSIPSSAKSIERSYITLIGQRGNSLSQDVVIPLHYGQVIVHPENKLTRFDYENWRLYFVLVDRFSNGSLANDHPVEDERIHPKANYYGGDLQGIQAVIAKGYFNDLGTNGLWISPIAQNPWGAYQEWMEPKRFYSGYHGYWPKSSSSVDERFGNNEVFAELIHDAHTSNHSVILDFVANHVHEEHPLIINHPDWKTPFYLEDSVPNIRIWDAQRLTTWFDPFLPTLDLENPEVRKNQVDSASFWMENFDLDGFRHDATKHIPYSFWEDLTQKVYSQSREKHQAMPFQIGETFGTRELIGSYVRPSRLDAQFDFNLYFDAVNCFAYEEGSLMSLTKSLDESLAYYGFHHLMGNISGNHDLTRFISLASGDIDRNEDPKLAGWTRDIQVTDTIGYARLKLLHAWNYAIPGIPILFYGDEIGIPGGNDPDNRRMMYFDGWNRQEEGVYDAVQRLNTYRSNHMSLIFGDWRVIETSKDYLVAERHYNDEITRIYLNKSATSHIFTLPCKEDCVTNRLHEQTKTDIIDLDPYSFQYITYRICD